MTDPKTTPLAAGTDPPKPMPFAIMRNAHEALRASIRLQEQKLEAGDIAGFRDEWQTFQRAVAVHMAMEDDSMFELLDGVSGGAITSANLPEEHVKDAVLATAVDAALGGADTTAVRAAWSAWKDDHLHHLTHEEEIMMPLTMKTAATPEARARVVHDRLLGPSEKLDNFDWYIGWVVSMLCRYGSASQPPNVATLANPFPAGRGFSVRPVAWN